MATRGDFVLVMKASTAGFSAAIRSAQTTYKNLITGMKSGNTLLQGSFQQVSSAMGSFNAKTRLLQTQGGRVTAVLKSMSVGALGLRSSFTALGRSTGGFSSGLLNMAFTIGIVTQALKAMTSAARELESGLAKVSTVLETKDLVALQNFEQGLQRLSVQFGRSTKELSDGLFEILQASIPPGQALEFLESSSKLAIGGFTDVRTAAKLAASVIKAFGLEATDVTEVMDILFTTQRRGITTISELAGSLGTILPTAKIVGIEFREVAAAVAALTRQGIKTSEAVTSLNRFMLSFVKNTKEGQEAAKALGFELDSTTLQTLGIAGAIRKLSDEAADLDLIAKIFPRITAVKGAAGLLQVVDELEEDLRTTFENVAGATEDAFNRVFDTTDEQLNRLGQTIKLVFADIFMPALKAIAGGTRASTDEFLALRTAIQNIRFAIGEAAITVFKFFGIFGGTLIDFIADARTNLFGLGVEFGKFITGVLMPRLGRAIFKFILNLGKLAINGLIELINVVLPEAIEIPTFDVDFGEVLSAFTEDVADFEIDTPQFDRFVERLKGAAVEFAQFRKELSKSIKKQRDEAVKNLSETAESAEVVAERTSAAAARAALNAEREAARTAATAKRKRTKEAAEAAELAADLAVKTKKAAETAKKAVERAARDAAKAVAKSARDIERELKRIEKARKATQRAIEKAAKEDEKALKKEADAFKQLADAAAKAAKAASDKRDEINNNAFQRELKAIDELNIAESQKLGFRLNALADFINAQRAAGKDTSKLEEEFNDLRRKRAEAIAKDIGAELEKSTSRQIQLLEEQLAALNAQANDIQKTASERAAAQRKGDKIERQLELEKLRQRRFDADKFFNDEEKALRKARGRGQITEEEFNAARERLNRGRVATELEALSKILDKEVLSESERGRLEKRRRGLAIKLAKERLGQISKDEEKAREELKQRAKDEDLSGKERKEAEKELEDEFDKRREEAVDEFLRKTGKAREVKAIEAAKMEAERALEGQEEGLNEAEKAQKRAEAQVNTFAQVLKDIANAIKESWKAAAEQIERAAAAAAKAAEAAKGALPVPGAEVPPTAADEEAEAAAAEKAEAIRKALAAVDVEIARIEAELRPEADRERARELGELRRLALARRAAILEGLTPEEVRAAELQAIEDQIARIEAELRPETDRARARELSRLRQVAIARREELLRATEEDVVPAIEAFTPDFIDPFGRRAPSQTTPAKTVDSLAAKLDEIIKCVCKKTGIDESVVRQNVMVKIQNDFTLTGMPEDIDLERMADKISRKFSDHLIDEVGFPPTSAFTGD